MPPKPMFRAPAVRGKARKAMTTAASPTPGRPAQRPSIKDRPPVNLDAKARRPADFIARARASREDARTTRRGAKIADLAARPSTRQTAAALQELAPPAPDRSWSGWQPDPGHTYAEHAREHVG